MVGLVRLLQPPRSIRRGMNDNTKNNRDDVRERLRKAWVSGDTYETCGILVADVGPRCIRWLLKRFQTISEEDAEDCFDAAIEGVLNRDPGKVEDVYNYVFTSARYAALDLVGEHKRYVRVDPEWFAGASIDRLLVIAEVALEEEVTVREEQLEQLFTLALPRLRGKRRHMAELLLKGGTSSSNEDLARELGVTKDALKSLKSRTLSDLRRLLPIAAEELRINLEAVLRPIPDVLRVRHSLPSESDEECGDQNSS